MGSISLSYTAPNLNPTSGYLPINNGTVNFADSVIFYGANRLISKPGGVTKGFQFDFSSNIYTIGDTNYLQFGTGVSNRAFNAVGSGITAIGSGGSSGQHLIVQVNGTSYKIALDLA